MSLPHFDVERSRSVWDNMLKRYGDPALLRQPGLPDRPVSYLPSNFNAMERMGQASNPADRKAVISALDPSSGLPLSPEPSERDVLVTLRLDQNGLPTMDAKGNMETDELLKITAPPARVGPSRNVLYWKLSVRA